MEATVVYRSHICKRSNALVLLVRPFELHRVGPDFLGLPGADIADLPIRIVVPPLTGNGVCNRFAEFMRRCRRERVQYGESARAPTATRVRHHRIEDLTRYIVVVST